MHRFGEKLRTLRKQHGLTMKQLVTKLEFTSQSYISELERGKKKPSLEIALKIANFFGVSVDQLAKDELELDLE